MRVGRGDAERFKVSRLPPHPSGLRPCPPTPSGLQPSPPDRGSRPSPPVGGRLLCCSNRGGLVLLWDVWIHILGIRVEYACLVGGRVWGLPLREPSKSGGGKPPPYGFPETVLKLGRGAPWGFHREHAPGRQRAGEGTRPYGAFTNGSTYKKRDRSGTCPLKQRSETQFRTKFFCLLFFQEK